MLSESQFQQIIYFLVFYKFIFLIFYTLHIYGWLFNRTVYENTFKWVVCMEAVFMFAMSIVLLYRFSKNVIQVSTEERFLMWTLVFLIMFDSIKTISSVEWV